LNLQVQNPRICAHLFYCTGRFAHVRSIGNNVNNMWMLSWFTEVFLAYNVLHHQAKPSRCKVPRHSLVWSTAEDRPIPVCPSVHSMPFSLVWFGQGLSQKCSGFPDPCAKAMLGFQPFSKAYPCSLTLMSAEDTCPHLLL
jgi:hypothetical protein